MLIDQQQIGFARDFLWEEQAALQDAHRILFCGIFPVAAILPGSQAFAGAGAYVRLPPATDLRALTENLADKVTHPRLVDFVTGIMDENAAQRERLRSGTPYEMAQTFDQCLERYDDQLDGHGLTVGDVNGEFIASIGRASFLLQYKEAVAKYIGNTTQNADGRDWSKIAKLCSDDRNVRNAGNNVVALPSSSVRSYVIYAIEEIGKDASKSIDALMHWQTAREAATQRQEWIAQVDEGFCLDRFDGTHGYKIDTGRLHALRA